ncbi:MAG TPA: MarR family transcriptional regulator [Microbacteriaceae bacterium]|jgi:DNA-binding MarR family transcriptional regulator|nr:MarR family transcriptional regulator [Microbacteriaceae bacterium]
MGKARQSVQNMQNDSISARRDALNDRLGYLLKHAQLRFAQLSAEALLPYGVTGRQCAILATIDGEGLLSQQDVAQLLKVDRTTMVALIDELETAGLVLRRTHPDDRRKNVVELTPAGRDSLRSADAARHRAETRFLASLSDAQAEAFRNALRALVDVDPA